MKECQLCRGLTCGAKNQRFPPHAPCLICFLAYRRTRNQRHQLQMASSKFNTEGRSYSLLGIRSVMRESLCNCIDKHFFLYCGRIAHLDCAPFSIHMDTLTLPVSEPANKFCRAVMCLRIHAHLHMGDHPFDKTYLGPRHICNSIFVIDCVFK